MTIQLKKSSLIVIESEIDMLRNMRKNAYVLCKYYNQNPPCERCFSDCFIDTIKIFIDKKILNITDFFE